MSAFAIGVDHPKLEVNIGTLFRSAHAFGAALLFTVSRRYEPKKERGDTVKSWRSIPMLHFKDWDAARDHFPFAWVPVGVEIGREDAEDLRQYKHPACAIYILGSEDGGLSNAAANVCRDIVVIPSKRCLNVAVAGSIVMYDRSAKR